MHAPNKLRSEQEGITATVGLVLVIGLALGVGLSTYISSWIPYEQSDKEYRTMREVEQNFRDFKQTVEGLGSGGLATVPIKMGAEPASAYSYISQGATLTAVPARYVDWFSPVYDTYVSENSPNQSHVSEDVLKVSPTGSTGSAATDHVVISEIQIRGNEFVELYNPKDSPENVENWWWCYYQVYDDWNAPSLSAQFPGGATIPAHGFYLIDVYGTPYSDWNLGSGSEQLDNANGSVAIFPPMDSINPDVDPTEVQASKIDAVAWGTLDSIIVMEGTKLSAPGLDNTQERKAQSTSTAASMRDAGSDLENGNGYDTDNNANDFVLENIPQPENSSSTPETPPSALGRLQRSYLQFDLRSTRPGSYPDLYDQYGDSFYNDVVIKEAKLWLYVDSIDLNAGENPQQLEIEVPVTVEAGSVENDNWGESMTWQTQPLMTQPSTYRTLESQLIDGQQQWVAWDVTSYVKKEFNEIMENWLADTFVSFCLREPENSSLERRAVFLSNDVASRHYDGHTVYGYREDIYGMYGQGNLKPYLEIVFSRGARAGTMHRSRVDAGYIVFDPKNREFPNQQFIYEGGGVIQQQNTWYELMIDPPDDFIVIEPADGNNIRVTVTYYRVTNEAARSGTLGDSISGTGWASVNATIAEEHYNYRSGPMPNMDEVTITIRTDHPSAWRNYLEDQLLPRLNYIVGGSWDTYGAWVTYDYDRVSVTIYGKDAGTQKGVDDIYYTERAVDLNVTLR